MAKPVEVKGRIQKITRVNGKAEAQMIVTIPVDQSTDIPLGEVTLIIEQVQGDLFEGPAPRRGRQQN